MLRLRTHLSRFLLIGLPILVSACATTTPSDPAGPAIAVAKSWQEALATRNFAQAFSLVAADFASPAWRTREDLRYYLVQARDRNYFDPAAIAAEPLTGAVEGDHVVVYPVSIRSRAGVAVFRLTLALRDAEWKIVSATVEFY